jgi:hypothetical protein
MSKSIFAVIALFIPVVCLAQEGYLCVSDKATGFKRDERTNAWETTRFKVEGEKFLLTKKAGAWSWSEFGLNQTVAQCSAMNDYGYLNCSSSLGEVSFNSRNLRFEVMFRGGYVSERVTTLPGPPDTPAITIGTCSKL